MTAVLAALATTIITPGDPGWGDARRAWNLAVDQHPAAVALPASAREVTDIVRFARELGLRVAAQGTGHNAAPLGRLAGTILVKTERMRQVTIDPAARIARAEAGAVWLDVVEAAARYGLVTLAGSSPDVGVVGYTIGGGMGWLGRAYGLSANNVEAIEVVTADGRLVRADARTEPDLFWALRGGGALAAIDADYALFAVGMAPSPQAVARSVASVQTAMSPWAARQMYLNLAETRRDPASFWTPQAYDRLRRTKTRVDPDDLIQANHPIAPFSP